MHFLKKSFPLLMVLSLLAVPCFYNTSLVYADEEPNDIRVAEQYDYSLIDDHALKAPPAVESSLETLAAYLTKPAKSEREKARAIFRWITSRVSYDVKSFFSGASADISPKSVLKSRTSVCSGFASLFRSLAQKAGLECVTVSGHAKGYNYLPGDTADSTNHDWNAVNIDGSWHLLDATWGAGFVNGKSFNRSFNEFYFLPSPEAFILSHYPVDPRWQLLHKPLPKAAFERFNKPYSHFFTLGFDWESLSHKDGVLRVKDRVTITLQNDTALAYLSSLKRNEAEIPFSTFAESGGGMTTISAEFPEPGRYEISIYAKKTGSNGSYQHILSYVVHADGISSVEPKGFPLAYEGFYSNGVELSSPMQGNLKSGAVYPFRIRIPGAEKAAVIMGNEFVYLENVGNDVFEGSARVNDTDLSVSYKNSSSKKFFSILKYNVI